MMKENRKKRYFQKVMMSALVFILILSGFLPGMFHGHTASAQQNKTIPLKYENFNDATAKDSLQMNGIAQFDDSKLRLTSAVTPYNSGSAFFENKIPLANQRSFSTYFSFQMHGGSGADGFVFTIQTQSNTALGDEGFQLGYSGIKPSLGIEFDTFNQGGNDTNDNHVGVDLNGSVSSKAMAQPTFDLRGDIRYAWIDYDGENDHLEVYVNDQPSRPSTPLLTYTVDLTAVLDQDEVYAGFTSSTGGHADNHDILSWYFDNDYDPIDLDQYTYSNATVSFDTNGGSAIPDQPVYYGESAVEPTPHPTRTGYTFKGWYSDAALTTPYDFNAKVKKNQTLYAKWQINSYTLTYSAGANGSIQGDLSQTIDYGNDGTPVTVEPNTGYHFVKWSDGDTHATRTDKNITDDENLTATFAINHYTVAYDTNNGTPINKQSVRHGNKVTEPTSLTRNGYVFAGWYTDNTFKSTFDFSATKITKNTTVYAKWDQLPSPPQNIETPSSLSGGKNSISWEATTDWGDGTDRHYVVELYDGKSWHPLANVSANENHTGTNVSTTVNIPKDLNTQDAQIRVKSTTEYGESPTVLSSPFIIDNTPPDLTLAGEKSIDVLYGKTFKDPGYQDVKDNFTKEKDLQVKVTGDVDTTEAGSYEITYSVIDNAGNQTVMKRTIHVYKIDKDNPTKETDSPIKTTEDINTTKPGTHRVNDSVIDNANNQTAVKQTTHDESGRLPKTATTNVLWFTIGAILLIIGTFTLGIRRISRRRNLE